jgi:hypothetical protein
MYNVSTDTLDLEGRRAHVRVRLRLNTNTCSFMYSFPFSQIITMFKCQCECSRHVSMFHCLRINYMNMYVALTITILDRIHK